MDTDEEDWVFPDEEEDPLANKIHRAYGIRIRGKKPKEMLQAYRVFCHLDPYQAIVLAGYFRMNSTQELASCHMSDWSVMSEWTGRAQTMPDGTSYRLMLTVSQQKRIKVFAWICHHFHRLDFQPYHFRPAKLRDEHYLPAEHQMELEVKNTVTIDNIHELHDLPSLGGSGSNSTKDLGMLWKEITEYLRTHYTKSGRPLDWTMRKNMYVQPWTVVDSLKSKAAHNNCDFFDFPMTDHWVQTRSAIVPPEHNESVRTTDTSNVQRWETGDRSDCRTHEFRQDSDLLFRIGKAVFKDTLASAHFAGREATRLGKGSKVRNCGRRAMLAVRGQHLGTDMIRSQVERCRNLLRNMTYSGESKNWNFDKHCLRAQETKTLMDFYADLSEGAVSKMSDFEYITAFLESIKDDCPYPKLHSIKTKIETERSKYPDLHINVIPALQGGIPTGPEARITKRNISSTGTEPNKRQRSGGRGGGRGGGGGGGRGRGGTSSKSSNQWGKLQKSGNGVSGTIEGLHYSSDCWALMSSDQRQECIRLRKQKQNERGREKARSEEESTNRIVSMVAEKLRKDRSRSRSRSRSKHSSRSRRRSRSRSHDRHDRDYSPTSGRRR